MLESDSDKTSDLRMFDVYGRDDSLLKILARKMNFKFKYLNIQPLFTSDNDTQPGELGLQMLQRRVREIYLLFFISNFTFLSCFSIFSVWQEADLLFGDVVVTYERMQEVEFSFFTLPDSGAFLTHAKRRLSEAFALVYPFQAEVWPLLIFTIIAVGPILYLMILFPEWMEKRKPRERKHLKSFHKMVYIREICRNRRKTIKGEKERSRRLNNDGLLSRCVWFTCHIFLRQCL